MATAVQYQAPSRDQLASEIRVFAPAMWLYRGAPEWFRMEIGGRDFHVPPHIPGEPRVEHPTQRDKDGAPTRVAANGRIAVRDIYGILRDARNRNQPIGIGLLTGMDAGSIVMFAVENFTESGVVWLRGDESDKVRMEASAKLYRRHKLEWAKGEADTRDTFVKRFLEKNPGGLPPPPTPGQILAREVVDSAALERRSGYAHICSVCYGWEGDSFEKYAVHMKAAHNREVTPPEDEVVDKRRPTAKVNLAELESVPQGAAEGAEVLGSDVGIPQQQSDIDELKAKMRKKLG